MNGFDTSWPWGLILRNEQMLPLPDGSEVRYERISNLLRTQIFSEDDSDKSGTYDLTILGENDVLSYTPTLPDKPVVLRSAHALRIAARSKIETMVPIPLMPNITVRNPKGDQDVLLQLPISSLSKTWFGDPKSGESAFSLSTPLYESGLSGNHGPWVASCPLVIRNTSSEILSFERLIIRVGLLSLYTGKNRFYTNQLTVKFRGQSQVSQIQIATKGPELSDESEDLNLFCGPRNKKERQLLNRSFSFIKSLAYD